MHRINLRGPWSLKLTVDECGRPTVSLKRSFNSPTNIDDTHVSVFLKLSFSLPPSKVELNGYAYPLNHHADLNAVNIGSYDMKSALLRHNQLTIWWMDYISNTNSNLVTVRLASDQADRWLADAWLEIAEY
jgi:hypothetical protein